MAVFTKVGTGSVTGTADDDIILIPSSAAAAGGTIDGLGGIDEIRFDNGVSFTLDLGAFAAVLSVEAVVLGTGSGAVADSTSTVALSIDASDYTANGLVLTGNAGNNFITGTILDDTMSGGAGNDVFILLSAAESVGDSFLGEAGTDEVRFASVDLDGETLFLDPSTVVELVVIGTGTGPTAVTTGLAPHDVVASAMSTSVQLIGNAGDNMLVGGQANDTLLGNAGADFLLGGLGNDQLDAGAGADFADGEEGADTYLVSNAADFEAGDVIADSGGAGNDRLEFRAASGVLTVGTNVTGIETIDAIGATPAAAIGINVLAAVTANLAINGNAAANALTGGSGNDTITGGAGGDNLAGGAGNDIFLVGEQPDSTGDVYAGGAGFDVVQFSPIAAPTAPTSTYSIAGTSSGVERYELTGTQAYHIDASAAANPAWLAGNSAANSLTGSAGHDTLEGGAGADTLRGGTGNDLFVLASAADYAAGEQIHGEAGNDTLSFNTALNETLVLAGPAATQGLENVVLGGTMNSGVDARAVVDGPLGVVGNSGDNMIVGTKAADNLAGGTGNDVFLVIAGAAGKNDLVSGGGNDDEVRFTSSSRGDTLTIKPGVTSVESFVIGDAAGITTGTTALNVNAAAASAGVRVTGNNGNNFITGSAHADVLAGNGGKDVLDGRDGNDTLLGGAGNDTFIGSAGVDLADFSGETAGVNASLTSNTASGASSGSDTFTGMENLAGGGFNDTLQGSSGANLILGRGGNDGIAGMDGNDTIDAGAGADTVGGGGGNDVLSGGVDPLGVTRLTDTLDFGLAVSGVTANLGTFSVAADGFGGIDTLVNDVAELERFERIAGSAFADSLTGSDVYAASSNLWQSKSPDMVEFFQGGGGNDTIDGGGTTFGHFDQAQYHNSTEAVFVYLGSGSITGGVLGALTVNGGTARDASGTGNIGTDTLINIDGVRGTGFADVLVGGSSSRSNNLVFFEVLEGGAGNDTLAGNATAFNSGGVTIEINEFDRADYINDPAAVNINLATGIGLDGFGGTDTLWDITEIRGSNFNDTLTGGNTLNGSTPGSGFEGFEGRAGNDIIDGGAGFDRANYNFTNGNGINANLSGGTMTMQGGAVVLSGTVHDGLGGVDTLINIEGVRGGDYDDWIVMSDTTSATEEASGRSGSDTLDGRAGTDRSSYDNDHDGGAGALTGNSYGVVVNVSSGTITTAGYASLTVGNFGVSSLASGLAIDGWGGIDTLISIENLRGSIYSDLLVGSSANNFLEGREGADTIDGGAGADTIQGGAGNDLLSAGVDVLGIDRVIDTLDFASGTSGVTVNLGSLTVANDGQGGVDTLVNDVAELERFERVLGSNFADSITGSDVYGGNSNLWQSKQTDLIEYYATSSGNDTFDGGGTTAGHLDIAQYNSISGIGVLAYLGGGSITSGPITVAGGTAQGNIAGGGVIGIDTLVNIDGVRGTSFHDLLVGGSNSRSTNLVLGEVFEGGAGNDTLAGNATAFNSSGTQVENNEFDRADYLNDPLAVNINLATGVGLDGFGGTDTLWDIAAVRGSNFADTLTGGHTLQNGFEGFDGRGGNDTIDGGAGFDRVDYNFTNGGGINANLSGGTMTMQGAVVVASGTATDGLGGVDSLINIEGVRGSDYDDWIVMSDTTSTQEEASGRAGNDTLDGRAGTDRSSYDNDHDGGAGALAGNGYGVVVNTSSGTITTAGYASLTVGNFGVSSLASGLAIDGWGGIDTLISIEYLRGSNYRDLLVGSAGADTIQGGAGNDTLSAGVDLVTTTRITDTLDLNQAQQGVIVNLGTFTVGNDGLGGTDTLVNDAAELERFERVAGSIYDDSLTGSDIYSASSNLWQSKATDMTEFYQGGAGNDTIDGGGTIAGHFDQAQYNGSSEAVFAYLGSGSITTGAGVILGGTARDASGTGSIDTDTLINIDGIRGTSFADVLVGGSSSRSTNLVFFEVLDGGAGDDTLAGNSIAYNSSGTLVDALSEYDRADYINDPSAVNINLATGVGLDGFGGTDTLWDISDVRGSNFNDTLTGGNPLQNGFEGFEGRGGNDTIDGGQGFDRANYNFTNGNGISANLSGSTETMLGGAVVLSGTVHDGLGGVDTLINIEGVRGGDFDDWIIMSNTTSTTEEASGRAGNDTMDGRGGSDRSSYDNDHDGGAGALTGNGYGVVINISSATITTTEYASFTAANFGFSAIATGVAIDGWGGIDALISIENLRGSNYRDLLVGSSGNNFLEGRAGDDTIDGGAGFDGVGFGGALNGVNVSLLTQSATGEGNDVFFSIENVTGGNFDDTITGDGGNNFLDGRWGNDTIDGGGGTDTVVFNGAFNGVDVDLSANSATGDGNDVIFNFENVNGSNFDDTITGNAGNNSLSGGLGSDDIDGGGGADTLQGGDGADVISGSGGADTIQGGGGNDTLSAGVDAVVLDREDDTLDFAAATSGATVDLGTFTVANDGQGGTDILTAADLERFERVQGSNFADSITGSDVYAADSILFQAKQTDLTEYYSGGSGNDTIDGGGDTRGHRDVAEYSNATEAVYVYLGSGSITSGAVTVSGGTARGGGAGGGGIGIDTLIDIDGIRGTSFADVLVGGGDELAFSSGNRFETYYGGAGNDTIAGNAIAFNSSGTSIEFVNEYDRADYVNDPGAVNINLATGVGLDGFGGTDALWDITHVRGSNFNDTLTGGSLQLNSGFEGFEGRGGNDIIDGGAGFDRVEYTYTGGEGINFNLSGGQLTMQGGAVVASGTVTDGLGSIDTLFNIEAVSGSDYEDWIVLSNASNIFEEANGRAGNDTMQGGSGTDRVSYINDYDGGAGALTGNGYGVVVNLSSATVTTADYGSLTAANFGVNSVDSNVAIDGWGGMDSLSGFENPRGSNYRDLLVGTVGNNTLEGRDGDDTMDGGAGFDTVTYTGAIGAVVIDLGTQSASGDGSDTLIDIEAATGSYYDDDIEGDSANNFLGGFFGNDSIDGEVGADTIQGGGGNDTLSAGVDTVLADTMIRVVDTLDFGSATSGVTVDLGTLTVANDGQGGVDTLANDVAELERFERVQGSSFADFITGSDAYDGDSNLWQGKQTDLIEYYASSGGNDTFDGGGTTAGHVDIAQYNNANTAVHAYLGSGSITSGFGTIDGGTARDSSGTGSIGTDTLVNIDGVRGTNFADVLVGGGDSRSGSSIRFEIFEGGAGNDTIAGNAAAYNSSGAAVLLAEFDRADYSNDPNAVNINLATGVGLDGYGGTDTLWDITHVRGSVWNDTLVGGNPLNDFVEVFEGLAGNDYIDGGSGFDRVDYIISNYEPVTGGGISANLSGVGINMLGGILVDPGTVLDNLMGVDTLVGIEGVRGTDFADWIVLSDSTTSNEDADGRAGNDTLVGGGGNDRVSHTNDHDGGGGSLSANGYGVVVNLSAITITTGDYASLTAANFGITSLAASTAQDGWGGTDNLSGFEHARGSGWNDLIVGSSGQSSIEGLAGNDTLSGGFDVVTTTRNADALIFSLSQAGVVVNLGTFTVANDGFGGTDTLVNDDLQRFERVSGSFFDDSITGSDVYAVTSDLWQSKQTDMSESYFGGGGNDTLDGGGAIAGHFDTASYFNSIGQEAVYAYLGSGSITAGAVVIAGGTARGAGTDGGTIGIDTLINIDGLRGTNFDDVLVGGSGSRTLSQVFFEVLDGGAGNDTLAGNAIAFNSSGTQIDILLEFDRADYINDPSAVNINLATGVGLDGFGGTDTLWDITELRGSNFDDTLTGGNALNNGFEGFEGRGGNDTIDGGSGFDRANYNFTNGIGINANLSGAEMTMQGAVVVATGTATDGLGGVDTLISIEGVRGSDYDDWIVMSNTTSTTEEASGRAGNDTLNGLGGTDRSAYDNDHDGGAGALTGNGYGVAINISSGTVTTTEWASLTAANFGVSSLASGFAIDGWGGIDTLISIEQLRGSIYRDLLVGSSVNNFLEGREGDDTIDGGAGFDQVGLGAAFGGVTIDLVTQTSSGEGSDVFFSIEAASGGNFNDTITGDSGNNFLDGVFGNDSINGGAGADTIRGHGGNDTLSAGVDPLGFDRVIDTLEFASATSGVTVNLGTLTVANDGQGGTDTLVNDVAELERFERVQGSNFADAITGSDVYGGDSNLWQSKQTDLIEFFASSSGNDTFNGGGTTAGHVDIAQYNNNLGNLAVLAYLGSGSITSGAITVNGGTAQGAIAGGGAVGIDTLVNIDGIRGTSFADVLVGGSSQAGATLNKYESFEGGDGNDTIAGNAAAFNSSGISGEFVSEFDQADYLNDPNAVNINLATGIGLDGYGRTDTLWDITHIRGSNFNDTLTGGNTNSNGLEGFEGRGGNDFIDGGVGFDRAHYLYTLGTGINANLSGSTMTMQGGAVVASGTATDGLGGIDTLVGIDGIRGSDYADWIVLSDGTALIEEADGKAGNDTLEGRGGTDRLSHVFDHDGGGGALSGNGYGVIVNLSGSAITTSEYASLNAANFGVASVAAFTAIDGWGGVDSFSGFEVARGSIWNDLLVGGQGANTIEGYAGNDTLSAGVDAVTTTRITDTLEFGGSPGGVTVNLGTFTVANDGWGGTDVLVNDVAELERFERVSGSNFADSLTGSDFYTPTSGLWQSKATDMAESYQGGMGNDTISGGTSSTAGHFDIAQYSNATEAVYVFLGDGTILAGEGAITISGSTARGAGTDGGSIGIDSLNFIDAVRGTNFADVLVGGSGEYSFNQSRFESFEGGAGNDTIAGNSIAYNSSGTQFNFLNEADRADYGSDPSAVNVNLATGVGLDGYGGTDTLWDITSVRGSSFNDTLTGSNLTFGGESYDGRGGNDTIDGAGGFDRVDHSFTNGNGISANLSGGTETMLGGAVVLAGTVHDGLGGVDTLTNIEAIRGGDYDDWIILSDTTLTTEEGNGRAGDDTIDGRGGSDRVSYDNDFDADGALAGNGYGAVVNISGSQITTGTHASLIAVNFGITSLDSGFARDPYGDTDTLLNIENVRGSVYNDLLVGNASGNTFEGRLGDDTVDGGGGSDTFTMGSALNAVAINLSAQTATGEGSDTLISIESAFGGIYNDTLVGDGGNNNLGGSFGNDTLTGGAGVDRFFFQSFIGVTLEGIGNVDTITDFEAGTDDLMVDDLYFVNSGVVGSGAGTAILSSSFISGAGLTTAGDADDRFIYNTSTGDLYYDSDGNGGGAAILFVTLSDLESITYNDILVN